MKISPIHIAALVLVLGIVWAFVTAPPPLADEKALAQAQISIESVMETIAKENDIVRSLYTASIVGAGIKAGLKFDEDWKDPEVEAGPLPALFLREAAASIERSSVPLGLFLGSDYPISPSNRFSGSQAPIFEEVKKNRSPEYFHDSTTGRWTAMFPDFSSVMACVTCHNNHPDSPKTDWVIDDVMGATTWSYPKERVSAEEFLQIIAAVRAGFRDAYQGYLAEIETFEKKPEVGTRWPSDGYYIPDQATFIAEFERRASSATVQHLLETGGDSP